jgi:hypothetical protein
VVKRNRTDAIGDLSSVTDKLFGGDIRHTSRKSVLVRTFDEHRTRFRFRASDLVDTEIRVSMLRKTVRALSRR